nr:DUF1127 domain-containing protein [Rhizobium lusitanum]
MSTIDTICAANAESGATRPKSHPMCRLWVTLLLWMQKREGRWVLRELTDDQLRDIGLTRREANTEANKSFFWD